MFYLQDDDYSKNWKSGVWSSTSSRLKTTHEKNISTQSPSQPNDPPMFTLCHVHFRDQHGGGVFSQPTCGLEPLTKRGIEPKNMSAKKWVKNAPKGWVELCWTIESSRNSADKNVGLNQQNNVYRTPKEWFPLHQPGGCFKPVKHMGWNQKESGVLQLKCGCAFFKLNECFALPRQNSLGDAGR